MHYINLYSEENKIFRVSTDVEGNSFLEVPSTLSTYRIDLTKDREDLELEAKELNLLGVLGYVDTEKGMEDYIFRALRLDVVIFNMGLDPGKELIFKSILKTFPGKEKTDPDDLSMSFKLEIDSPLDIPIFLPQLIEAMTKFIMMFNHRLIDSGLCLN